MSFRLIPAMFIFLALHRSANAIFCYKCESYRDFRCLDPFDYTPHVQVNCDFEPFVRDRKPVFCEKTTELIDGVYYTTRGCSTKQWEDVDQYRDFVNMDMRCFRYGAVEQCLCNENSCNSAPKMLTSNVCLSFLILLLLTIFCFWF